MSDRLYRLVAPQPWMAQAACKGLASRLFFPDREDVTATKLARQVCFRCPVRQECLDHALREHERDGIWGGLSPKQRRTYRKMHPEV